MGGFEKQIQIRRKHDRFNETFHKLHPNMNITALESAIAPFSSSERRHRNKVSPYAEPHKIPSNDRANDFVVSCVDATSYASTLDRHRKNLGTSKAIPISKSMKRTPSEIQLLEDEALADYRDYCMYTRIVNGMSEKKGHPFRIKVDESLSNIIRTRHLPVRDCSYQEDYLQDVYLRERSTLESACKLTNSMFCSTPHPVVRSSAVIIDESDDEDEGIFVMDL